MVAAGEVYRGKPASPLTITIKYVGESNVFVLTDTGLEDILSLDGLKRYYTKVEPFFEVGKTYERIGHHTFKCLGVVENDGEKMAVGRFRVNGEWGQLTTNYRPNDWTEVK